MIYFDHAATTPLDREVFEKMTPYFTEIFGNPDSTHSFGRKAMAGVDEARDCIAKTIGVKPSEVYFTSGGSEADTWAMKSSFLAQKEKGKHIILSSVEHHAMINCAKQLKKEGAEVTFLPVNEKGIVERETLERAVREDTVFVGIMHANNEVGSIQDIRALAPVAKRYGAVFFSDCVQSAGVLPLPVDCVDMCSFSAHKFYGPKGVGALVVRNKTPLVNLIDGGEQERGLRGGTTNVPAVVGMAFALKKAYEQREENNETVASLRNAFEREVRKKIEGVTVNGHEGQRLPSNCNLAFDRVDGTALLFRLDLKGIAVSLGSACASGSIEPSHVLTAMGLSRRLASSSVRFTLGKDNTMQEVAYAVDTLVQTVADLRK